VVTLTVEKSSVPTPERGSAALRNLGQYFGIVANVESIINSWQTSTPKKDGS